MLEQKQFIYIDPRYRGGIVDADLLMTIGHMSFDFYISKIDVTLPMFTVFYGSYTFGLGYKNGFISALRTGVTIDLPVHEFVQSGKEMRISIEWGHADLYIQVDCNGETRSKKASIRPVAPPFELIKWAKQQNLLDVRTYPSEEKFREKVYSCLTTIQDKIHKTDSYIAYWSIHHNGKKIESRVPRTEVEIQPMIHGLLSDQMLMSSIEVIPEAHSGSGDLDFLFTAQVDNCGLRKICVEFKLAHREIENGIFHQLPKYMDSHDAKYGAFCIFDYRGEWFDKPSQPDRKHLDHYLGDLNKKRPSPYFGRIRIFVINLAKPPTASRKCKTTS